MRVFLCPRSVLCINFKKKYFSENDEIDFKEFLLALGETKDFTEMEGKFK